MAGTGDIFGNRNKRGRAWGEEDFAYLERLGRELDPSLENDLTGSLIAQARGASEAVRLAIEYRKAHPPLLSVPDAESLGQFLKNARKVYGEVHATKQTRGRKFTEGLGLAWISELKKELKREPTRKEILHRLTDIEKYGVNTVSPRKAGPIAKLYALLASRPRRFSKEEARWLRSNFGPKRRSPHWWSRKNDQWLQDLLVTTGVSQYIKNCFSKGSTAVTEEDYDSKIQQLLEADKRWEAELRLTFQNKNSSPSS